MSRGEVSALVLHARYASRLSYFDDWLDAFTRAPGFRVRALDICTRGARRALRRDIAAYDAVVLLHSTNADTLVYLDPLRSALKTRRGKLVVFVGNEVNLPGSPMADKIGFLRDVEADVIATQLVEEAGEWLYRECPGATVVSVPHGLNPAAFRPTTEDADRSIDIGTWSARYVAYLGDDDRNRLFAFVSRHDFDPSLAVDINTADRLDRAGWAAYLNRCKGTVSNEAGSWYLERDDRTARRIRAWVAETRGRSGVVIANDSRLRQLGHRLPGFVKDGLKRLMRSGPIRHEMLLNETLDHAEIYARFFADTSPAPVYTKVVSSRHFDAIGTKTCQILVRGRYNDVLVPGEHYLELAPDFTNIDEVMAGFRDPGRRRRMVDAAHDHAMSAHTLDHRVASLRASLD